MLPSLSARTIELIGVMFAPKERDRAAQLLTERCGNNLFGLETLDSVGLERCRFDALKLSRGDLGALEKAVELAQTDWRDLLVGADFEKDLTAHEAWFSNRHPT